MTNVTPYFELHIRPMFRLIDRDRMSGSLDLWSYDEVKAWAEDIIRHLKPPPDDPGIAIMPPTEWGGPWPGGWIDVFVAWKDAGFPRLASTSGTYSLSALADGTKSLQVRVSLANGAETAWIDRLLPSPTTEEYTLFHRPAAGGATEPARNVFIRQRVPAGISEVYLVDANGRHLLPATT